MKYRILECKQGYRAEIGIEDRGILKFEPVEFHCDYLIHSEPTYYSTRAKAVNACIRHHERCNYDNSVEPKVVAEFEL